MAALTCRDLSWKCYHGVVLHLPTALAPEGNNALDRAMEAYSCLSPSWGIVSEPATTRRLMDGGILGAWFVEAGR